MASSSRTTKGDEAAESAEAAAYRARPSVREATALCAAALETLASREGAFAPADLGAARRALHAPACALLHAALAAEPTCAAALLLLRALYHDHPALFDPAHASFEELGWRASHAPRVARSHWRTVVAQWASTATTTAGRPNPFAQFLAAYYADRVDGAYATAVPLLRAAADGAALSLANNCLGSFYEFGDGVARDARAAAAHFRRAAAHAHAGAQCNLGVLLTSPDTENDDENDDAGEADPERLAEGVALLRASIAQGHPGARVRLAQLYLTSRGVAFDLDTAFALLDAARAARCLDAAVLAATLVLLDVDTRTPKRAAPALLRAPARLGHEEAMHRLGLYSAGELGGAPARPRRAAHWLHRAARAGVAEAAERLARLALAGRGVRRSPAAALRLLMRARELGCAAALGTTAANFCCDTPATAIAGVAGAAADLVPVLAGREFRAAPPRTAANMLALYAECAAREPDTVRTADLATTVVPALVARPSWRSALVLSNLARLRLPHPTIALAPCSSLLLLLLPMCRLTDVEAGQTAVHALRPFLAAAGQCLERDLPRAPRGPSVSLLAFLTSRGTPATAEHRALPLAPNVLRTLRSEADAWTVPFRDSALGPIAADTALLASWHDQTLNAWLPSIVCSFFFSSHCASALCVTCLSVCGCTCKKDHVLHGMLRESQPQTGRRQRRLSAAPPPRVPGTCAGHLRVLSPDHPRQRQR